MFMRIYGVKLPAKIRFVHEDDYDSCDEECQTINPEVTYSGACHLYSDFEGGQYIGFELSLGMHENEMRSLLGKKGRVYTVLGV